MDSAETTRGNGRRTKSASKETTVAETKRDTDNTVNVEKTESNAAKAATAKPAEVKAEPTALSLSSNSKSSQGGALEVAGLDGDRPSSSSEMEIFGNFTSSGIRPIAASHFEVYGTILNNRPIMASHLEVLNMALPGESPIFASDLIVRDDLTLPGGRPIVASDPRLMEADLLMGGRPIASNNLAQDNGEMPMGYID